MDHYVAYHSAHVMGRPYVAGDSLNFLSSKPEAVLRKALGARVWVVAGERQGSRTTYALAGVYTCTDVERDGDTCIVDGPGATFQAAITLNHLGWFQELREEQNNFSLGFNPIRSENVIAELERLLSSNGLETHLLGTDAAAHKLAALLPDPTVRDSLLRKFVDSMRFIRQRRPDWCLIRSTPTSLRLFAGRLIVLSLHRHEAWLATVPSGQSDLANLPSWRWDTKSYPEYRRIPSKNGYYSPAMDTGNDWPAIREQHFAYLEQAVTPGVAPDHRSTAQHDAALATYLLEAVNPHPAAPAVGVVGTARIREVFAHLDYQRDVRRPPDERRQAQFRTGWDDAAQHAKVYEDHTLERLTWRNLGYRLGREFGAQTPAQVDEAFTILAELYQVEVEKVGEPDASVSFTHSEFFPVLARLILRAAADNPGSFVTHDALVDLVLADGAGSGLVSRCRAKSSWPDDRSAASNMIAWFSQQISVERSEWVDFFERERVAGAWAYRPAAAATRPGAISESDASAIEGEPRMFLHIRRERDPALVKAKRDASRNTAGQLECEACGFVAQAVYSGCTSGELCEVHHRNPLGDLGTATTETRLEDLAVLCPNCHRAIHQTRPMMTVEEFRERLGKR